MLSPFLVCRPKRASSGLPRCCRSLLWCQFRTSAIIFLHSFSFLGVGRNVSAPAGKELLPPPSIAMQLLAHLLIIPLHTGKRAHTHTLTRDIPAQFHFFIWIRQSYVDQGHQWFRLGNTQPKEAAAATLLTRLHDWCLLQGSHGAAARLNAVHLYTLSTGLWTL